jgi:PPM family protein phosphatase
MFFKRNKSKPEPEETIEVVETQPPDIDQQSSTATGYEVVASLISDVGCVREVNEDNGRYVSPGDTSLLRSKGLLAIVADGMGGHSAGEVASKIAVDVIHRAYYESDRDVATAIESAVLEANREIYKTAQNDESLHGMGTTCLAFVLRDGSALAAHVGDSRLYLVRDGQIYLMTEDHSAVMEMVKRGIISLEEARHHPDKNVILRALGSHPEVEVSVWAEPFPVSPGDSFLLCSDGLYDLVEDEEIREVVVNNDPSPACQRLVDLAKERGGHDNITVGIVSLKPLLDGTPKPVRETRVREAPL